MTAGLQIRLVAAEVVDGGLTPVAVLLFGTHRVDLVPHHLERLERYHNLVVLDEVAGEEQNLLSGHGHHPVSSCRVRIKSQVNYQLCVTRRATSALLRCLPASR